MQTKGKKRLIRCALAPNQKQIDESPYRVSDGINEKGDVVPLVSLPPGLAGRLVEPS